MRKKIKRLSIDPIFCILTRAGLNEKLRKERRTFDLLLIDFNDIHLLNKCYGYDHVNSLFKKLFKTFNFRKTDLVARWFSGDEIAIITFQGDIDKLYRRFQFHCLGQGLMFKFHIYRNLTSTSMNEITPYF